VDDGSTDGTLAAIRTHAKADPRVRYLSLSRNFGHQQAIKAGLGQARGNTVVIMDGDLQDPPEVIPELYGKYTEGYDVVYAQRRTRQDEVFWKKWAAALFYRSLKRITRIDIPLDTGDFRLISRKVLRSLLSLNETQPFLRGQIAWLGFKQTFHLYDRMGRAAGERKYTVRKLIRLAMDGITSFSSAPLRLASVAGFVVSGVSFFIILYALWSKLGRGHVISGWTSLIISTMFIGGVQLICLGIIGEYIQRISNEVRRRPPYVVKEDSEEPRTGPQHGH
jgi:dolichol-phosphate mannosyltransferase